MSQAKKWKDAWPALADAVRPEALAKFGPFPSLYVNDYVRTLADRGVDAETIRFITDLVRELNWAYDNWTRSCMAPSDFLRDLVASVSMERTPGSEVLMKIIRDYRASHNIPDPDVADGEEMPSWAHPNAVTSMGGTF